MPAVLREVGLSLAVVLAMCLMLVCLPVILPFLAVSGWLEKRRQLAALASMGCSTCGATLDGRALDLSDAAPRRDRPGMRVRARRFIRHVHAICPACAAEYTWDGRARLFRPYARDPMDTASPAPDSDAVELGRERCG